MTEHRSLCRVRRAFVLTQLVMLLIWKLKYLQSWSSLNVAQALQNEDVPKKSHFPCSPGVDSVVFNHALLCAEASGISEHLFFFFFPPIVQPTMWISFSLFCILLKFSCESQIVLLLPWALVSAPYCWKGFKHHFPCDLWNEARSWYCILQIQILELHRAWKHSLILGTKFKALRAWRFSATQTLQVFYIYF